MARWRRPQTGEAYSGLDFELQMLSYRVRLAPWEERRPASPALKTAVARVQAMVDRLPRGERAARQAQLDDLLALDGYRPTAPPAHPDVAHLDERRVRDA